VADSRGKFVSLEGNEGCGKSTQIALLTDRLRSAGRDVIALREPGGTGLGEALRDILKTPKEGVEIDPVSELLLMNASRAQLVRQVIEPELARGSIVLVDRFFDSTVVYQGYGRGLDLALVRKTIEVAVGVTIPDLTLLLKVPLHVSESRRASRAQTSGPERDRFEEAERAFFERIERGYDAIADESSGRVKVIDATRDIDAVHRAIWSEVSGCLQ
jgi:dTMP kinase